MTKSVTMIGLLAMLFLAACAADGENQPAITTTGAPATQSAFVETSGPDAAATAPSGNCYQLGYKWGVCAAKATADGSCDPKSPEIAIPPTCANQPETRQGIQDGINSVQSTLQ